MESPIDYSQFVQEYYEDFDTSSYTDEDFAHDEEIIMKEYMDYLSTFTQDDDQDL